VGATEDNEPGKPRAGRSRDGSDSALFLLAVGAAVAAPCSWLLFYYDQKYIGDVDDRIAFIYATPVLLSLIWIIGSQEGVDLLCLISWGDLRSASWWVEASRAFGSDGGSC